MSSKTLVERELDAAARGQKSGTPKRIRHSRNCIDLRPFEDLTKELQTRSKNMRGDKQNIMAKYFPIGSISVGLSSKAGHGADDEVFVHVGLSGRSMYR